MTYNKKKFAENFPGMNDLAKETIKTFLVSVPTLLLKMENAVKEKKFKELELAAHTLKGSAGVFFADETVRLATKLEHQGKTGDMIESDSTFKILKDESMRLVLELTDYLNDV